jgi:hypothetical protein
VSTTKGALRDLIATLLSTEVGGQYPTNAGDNVFTPGDWATFTGQYPVILCRAPREEKEPWGGYGETEFKVTATIELIARVQAPSAQGDAGALAAENDLETLESQIQGTVINNPALRGLISQIASVQSELAVTAKGQQHIGELVIRYGLEFYQGPEDFYVPTGPALEEVAIGWNQNPATGAPTIGALVEPPQD